EDDLHGRDKSLKTTFKIIGLQGFYQYGCARLARRPAGLSGTLLQKIAYRCGWPGYSLRAVSFCRGRVSARCNTTKNNNAREVVLSQELFLYERISRRLLEQIRAGSYAVGEKLPSVRH